MRENTDQEKLRIWTLFSQCPVFAFSEGPGPVLFGFIKYVTGVSLQGTLDISSLQ